MSNISSLAHQLAEKHLLDEKSAESFIKTFFTVLMDGLQRDKTVKVKGLGTFKVTSVAPRESVDVNTGERIIIEGRDKISFIPDTAMRDLVNRPFSQFETVTVNDNVDFDSVDKKFAADSVAAMNEVLGENLNAARADVQQQSTQAQPDETAENSSVAEENQSDETSTAVEQPTVEEQPVIKKEEMSMPETEKPEDGQQTLPTSDEEEITSEEESSHEDAQPVQEKQSSNENVESAEEELVKEESVAEKLAQVEKEMPIPPIEESLQESEDEKPTQVENVIPTPPTEQPLQEPVEEKPSQVEKEIPTPPAEEPDNEGQAQQEEPSEGQEGASETPSAQTENLSSAPTEEPSSSRQHSEMENQLMEELKKSNRKVKTLTILVCVVGALVIALIVFSVVQWRGFSRVETKTLPVTVKKGIVVPPTTKPDTKAAKNNDTANVVMPKPKKTVPVQKPAAKTPAPVTKQKAKATPKKEETFKDYVDNVRVRTGAYNIVGIDKTVTVKSGQTLYSISKLYLGPGMECYVEAVNGGRTEFKAGEKIRIPSLKLKRRKK